MGGTKSSALMYGRQQREAQSLQKSILTIVASLITLALLAFLLVFSFSSISSHSKYGSSPHSKPSTTVSPPPRPPSSSITVSPKSASAAASNNISPTLAPSPSRAPTRLPSNVAEVRVACKATRNPETCQKSLSKRVPSDPTPNEMIEAAISLTIENLKTAKKMVVLIKDSSKGNKNKTTASEICLQQLDYSDYRMNSAAKALQSGKTKDARAWFSAALAYQNDCWGGFKYVNDTKLVVDTMLFLDSLMGLSSNALEMMSSFDNYGSNFNKWQAPKTERDGFWEKMEDGEGVLSSFKGGVPIKLKVNAKVCKTGGCDYKKVQDAVNAATKNDSNGKFVIHIKEGSYEERVRVPFDRKNVVFLGDGIGKTIITGSANVGQVGMTTYESATVGMSSD